MASRLRDRDAADKAEQRRSEREATWRPIHDALRKADGARALELVADAYRVRPGLGNAMWYRCVDFLEAGLATFGGSPLMTITSLVWYIAEAAAWKAGDPPPGSIDPPTYHDLPELVATLAAWHRSGAPELADMPWHAGASAGPAQLNLDAVGVA